MVGVICEPGFETVFLTKQQYCNITTEFKRRRIKYSVFEKICDINNWKGIGQIVILAIGHTKAWCNYVVERCNTINLRVIIVGNYFPDTADGIFSCVISDVRNSAIDIYNYFTVYDKKKVILYGVNTFSDFDLKLETEMLKIYPKEDLYVIRKEGNKEQVINSFFDVYNQYNAVVCTNDYDAVELLCEIKKRNPAFLSRSFLVSFSNTLLSLLYSPSVTTFYESTTENTKNVIKLYYMLIQNPEISNINLYVREKLKIRETTHYRPYSSAEFSHSSAALINDTEDWNHINCVEDSVDTSKVVTELHKIENMILVFDKVDFSILFLFLNKKTTTEISDILYISRGSVRYRLNKMLEKLGLSSKEEMAELISRYITKEALVKYSEDYL